MRTCSGVSCVLEQLVFDAVKGERAGGVEAERLEVARQHLHRRDAAGLDRLDELGAGGEREIFAAPEAEPLGIGEIVDRRGAGRRDIDDARVRQGMLQAQARPALLRGGGIAAFALAAGGILHGVGLVEDDHAVEIPAQPIDDLLDPRNLLVALVGAQRGIGGEKDAFCQRIGVPCRKRDERRDQQPLHAERRPVALRILDQLVGLADPDRLAAALEPVVEHDAGDLAALAGAGAVAEKPATAEADGAVGVIGRGGDDIEGLVDGPGAGEMFGMGLAGIDDGLELRVGEEASETTFAGRCGR